MCNVNDSNPQDEDKITIEECEEDSDGFSEVEFDKNAHHLAYEDKPGKKTEKELSRLKWNGQIPNENLGKGQ